MTDTRFGGGRIDDWRKVVSNHLRRLKGGRRGNGPAAQRVAVQVTGVDVPPVQIPRLTVGAVEVAPNKGDPGEADRHRAPPGDLGPWQAVVTLTAVLVAGLAVGYLVGRWPLLKSRPPTPSP